MQEALTPIIMVSEPAIDTSEGSSFVSYLVRGSDQQGQFLARRRYRDFHLLREKMREKWVGIYLPPIPSKKFGGNTEDTFVAERKRFLSYFCHKIAERPYLFSCHIFQRFLRGNQSFEQEAKLLHPVDYDTMKDVYKKSFSQLNEENLAELMMSNETEYDFLKKSQKKLQELRDNFRDIAEAKRAYNQQLISCMHSVVPQYEKKFYIHHVQQDQGKLIISNKVEYQNKVQEIKEYSKHNPLEEYCQLLSCQLRESRALLEAIDSRKDAEEQKRKFEKQRRGAKQELQNLQAGKSTFKSLFSSGNKEGLKKKLETTIGICEIKQQALESMMPCMHANIRLQIKAFFNSRKNEYENTLQSVAKKEIKELGSYGELLRMGIAIK